VSIGADWTYPQYRTKKDRFAIQGGWMLDRDTLINRGASVKVHKPQETYPDAETKAIKQGYYLELSYQKQAAALQLLCKSLTPVRSSVSAR